MRARDEESAQLQLQVVREALEWTLRDLRDCIEALAIAERRAEGAERQCRDLRAELLNALARIKDSGPGGATTSDPWEDSARPAGLGDTTTETETS